MQCNVYTPPLNQLRCMQEAHAGDRSVPLFPETPDFLKQARYCEEEWCMCAGVTPAAPTDDGAPQLTAKLSVQGKEVLNFTASSPEEAAQAYDSVVVKYRQQPDDNGYPPISTLLGLRV